MEPTFRNPSLFPILVGFVVAATILCATWFISVSEHRRQTLGERLNTVQQMHTVQARLEAALASLPLLVKPIISYISINGDIDHETFQSLAKELVAEDHMLRTISLIKGASIVDVYPIHGNEKVAGIDSAEILGQPESSQRVIEARRAVITDAVGLVQGKLRIINRIPIFSTPKGSPLGSGDYWGQAIVVTLEDTLLKEAGILDPPSGLKYAFRISDASGAGGGVFWGNEGIFQLSPVILDVKIPGGTWQMAAMPAAGWISQRTSTLWIWGIGSFWSILLGVMVWSLLATRQEFRNRLILKRSLMEKAEESEAKYRTIFESSNDAMLILKDDKIIDCNTASLQMFGCARHQMVGSYPRLLSPPRQPDGNDSTVKGNEKIAAALSGRPQFFEWKHCRHDRMLFDAEVSLNSLDVHGEMIVQATIRDITDRKRTEEEIKKSLSLLRSTLESTADGILVVDRDDKISAFNQRFLDLWKIPQNIIDSLENQKLMTFVLDQLVNPEAFLMKLKHLNTNPDMESFDTLEFKDGRVFERYSRAQQIANTSVGRVWSFRDVTERKLFINILNMEKQRFQKLAESAPFGMLIIQSDGSFSYANPKFIEIFGYKLSDVPNGREWFRKAFPDHGLRHEAISTWIEDCMHCQEGQTLTRVFPVMTEEGTEKIIHFYYVKLSAGEDLITCEDITDRKNAEMELLLSEKKYRSLFEESKDGIFIAQVDGTLVDVNQSFLDLFGYEREEMQGRNVIMTSVNPSDGVGFMSEIQNYDYVKDYPLDLLKKDGSFMNCLLTGTVRRNEDGAIEGYRGIIRDITVQRSLETQLLQAQKMEAVGTLAGGIAHDFNNILQAVLGYSELMLLGKDDQDRDYPNLKKIQQAGQRGADLVKSLLMFSRKIEATKVCVNLNLEVLQAQDILSHTIPKIIKIELRLSENLLSIQADPSQINQILMNLGINARDAMPNGGTLIFETANVGLDQEYCASHVEIVPGNYVQLTVSDTGQGMDNRTLEHIFEPFFTTKEIGKGTGLGLATVFGIVKRHGGHIICLSELGHGTTFKIYFPAAQFKERLEPSASMDEMQEGKETILLVDDEESLRDFGAALLNNFGYEVITACNGKEALAIYRKHKNKISLILLDLIMPEMDGRQCLAEMLLIDPKAKILVASGYSENGLNDEIVEAKARGFVRKPYNITTLLTTVRDALNRN